MDKPERNNTEEWLLTKVAPAIAKFAHNHPGWLENYAAHVNQLIAELETK